MKTPSSLPLLVLFAALPAAAAAATLPPASAIKPGDRCDKAFLEAVVEVFPNVSSIPDERIEYADRVIDGGETVKRQVLKFGDLKVCEAGTWRHLASGTPLAWRNAEAKKYWDAGNAKQNASLVLVADDFFKTFDPKAASVLAAADAVIEAGVQLGVITTADAAKPLSELLPGASGGPFGVLKPKTVTPVAALNQKANLAPELVGPTLRKLLDETGAAKGGGEAVMSFRLAVLALNAELGRLGGSNATVVKRLGAQVAGLKDLTPGLPNGYVPPKVEKAAALDDVKYGAALAALIGAGVTPALDDAAPRAGSLLEPADLGLRNLVAIRAAQVEQIAALAKARLNGKTVTQIEVSARAAGAVKDQPNSLAAAVLQRLAQTPEYAKLDSLYENNLREKGPEWAKLPEAQAMAAARKELTDAALSAKIEKVDGRDAVVFTHGDTRRVLSSLVPSSVENDPAERAAAAAIISRLIITGALDDAKYQAAAAALGGSGQPGQPLDTNLKPGEVAVSKDVPPATKKIRDGAAGCDSPKDLIRNDYETYAARQRAAAAEMASGNVRSRNDVEKKRLEQLAASAIACQKKKDEAAAIKQDYFDDPAIAKAAREKAAGEAEAWCAADKKGIEDAAQAKIKELAAAEAGDRDPAKVRAKADADLAAGFAVAIAASVETLRKDYTTPGSRRLTCSPTPEAPCTAAQKRLSEITRNSPRLTAFTALWFAKEWPQDESKKAVLEAAVAACAKELGLGDASSSPSYRNPDNPDNVDKYCKVNEKLTKYIVDSKGSVQPAP